MRTPVLDPAPTPPPAADNAQDPPPSAPRAKRRELDFYETNAELTDLLLLHVDFRGPGIAEPCNGLGAITRRLRERVPGLVVRTYDIDPRKEPETVADARTLAYPDDIDAVITNPPFSDAFEILTNAHKQGLGIALLLRLSFLEPSLDRGEWLTMHPPDLVIVCPRVSFTDDGQTDSVTCAWMVWQGQRSIFHIPYSRRVAIELTPGWHKKQARKADRVTKKAQRLAEREAKRAAREAKRAARKAKQ